MENDRYKQSPALYITGIISLVISLTLFAFTAYILPYLIFEWRYDIPEFIAHWHHGLQLKHAFSEAAASWLIFLFFFLLACLSGIVAYYASNHVDNAIYGIEPEPVEKPEEVRVELTEGTRLVFKIIFLILVVIIAAIVFELLLYIPPVSPQ